MPSIQLHSMVSINNDIYIFGGRNNTTTLGDFYKINALTCNIVYTNNNIGISNRYSHNMVAINNDIYIYGGIGNNGVILNDFYKIDTLNCNLTTIYINTDTDTDIIPGTRSFGMVSISNDIYIFGGLYRNNTVTNNFYKITKE